MKRRSLPARRVHRAHAFGDQRPPGHEHCEGRIHKRTSGVASRLFGNSRFLSGPPQRRQRRCQFELAGEPNLPVLRAVGRTPVYRRPQVSSFVGNLELHEVDPILRPRHRPLSETNRRPTSSALSQAAPRPVLRTRDQPCSKGIPLDVSAQPKKIGVARHSERLKSPLIDVTGAGSASPRVPSLAVGRGQPRHERR